MERVRPSEAAESGDAAPQRWSTLTAGELAWIALVPCLLALVGAIVVLGPALGRVLFPPDAAGLAFWPHWVRDGSVRPEPTEHARYLLALAAPLALSGVTALGVEREWGVAPRLRAVAVGIGQVLVPLLLVVGLAGQRAFAYGSVYLFSPPRHRAYFTPATLIVAALLVGLVVLLLNWRAVLDRIVAGLRETRGLRLVASLCAAAFTADWLLTALNTDGSIGLAHRGVRVSIPFWLDETFAVLDGRTPLVNFDPQYSHLWPFAMAGAMKLLGTSVGVYTTVMVLASAAALLAVYALLRRVTRSSAAALALYLPFLATGFFMELGPLANRYSPANLLSEFPMRYGGPYVLAWLTARRIDGAGPRLRPLLFSVAGVVVINNAEFGLPALGAVLAAELWTGGRPTRRTVLLLARDALAGLAVAALLVSLLTLVVAGSLPHFGTLLFFSRLYGVGGFGMLPMPTLGFHLVIYATFAGAIVLASVRALGGRAEPLLTGMLAWSGVFGLGAGSYFVGRSHPEVLIDLFSVWALTLALLVVAVVRDLGLRPRRVPSPAQLTVLAAFALAVCSIAQTPTPWSQAERLSHASAKPLLPNAEIEAFVAESVRRGEAVAILTTLGHRIAYDLGVENVAPYASVESMPTVQQIDETIAQLRAAGGHRVFLDYGITLDEIVQRIERHGFVLRRRSPGGMFELDDARAGA